MSGTTLASVGVSGSTASGDSSPSAPLASAASEAAAGEYQSVMMLLSSVFHKSLEDFSNDGRIILDKTNAKTAAMKQLELLRSDVKIWNESVIGNQLQVQKTDEILLSGVQIPQSAYGRCAYKIGQAESGEILYADFPPKIFEDFIQDGIKPAEGELVYEEISAEYKVYSKGALIDVYSLISSKSVPGPNVDFSAEPVGSIIFVESSKKYYRVASDGSGVEITDFPLQKFISVLSETGAADLDRALENRVTAVRDLSKKDLLDIHQITSLIQVMATALIGILSSLTTSSNNIIRNI